MSSKTGRRGVGWGHSTLRASTGACPSYLTLILLKQHRKGSQQRCPRHIQHGADGLAVARLKEGDALGALPGRVQRQDEGLKAVGGYTHQRHAASNGGQHAPT